MARSRKNYASMKGGDLPKVRYPLITFDMERGKVGWAHWRRSKKRATSRYERHVVAKQIVREQLDEL